MAIPGSTLGDLQTRIQTETNRDDLADALLNQLNQSISDAINFYANERFWFNELRVVTTVQAGSQYTPLPTGYNVIDDFWIQVGSVQFPLLKRTNEELESLYLIPQIGQPILWAPYLTQARVWPTPSVNYPGTWLTISDVTPALDYTNAASSNTWTMDGQWLICAKVKEVLYRNVFKDQAGLAGAMLDVEAAYSNLKGLSNKRVATGMLRAAW